MTVRRANLLLWTAAGVLGAGAMTVLSFGMLWPVTGSSPPQPPSVAAPTTTRAPSPTPTTAPTLAGYDSVWTLRLRQPLNAPAAAPAVAAAPKPVAAPAQFPVTLVGTVGDSLAMLKMPNGEVQVKRVGESAGGAKIVAVRRAQADVQLNGQLVTLHKPKEPTP